MFRKFVIAIAATATIGAAALAPTAASAKPWGWGWGWGWHHHFYHHWVGFYGPRYIAYDGCYLVKRVVYTPYGKRIRRVEVCY
jgi:hypothetical protein